MYKDLYRTCSAIFLLIKTFVWQRFRCRRRRGLLKLPLKLPTKTRWRTFACASSDAHSSALSLDKRISTSTRSKNKNQFSTYFSIFPRLTVELAGIYALVVIYCLFRNVRWYVRD